MALKWILGNFKDGSISESNVLPVIKDSGDTIEMNINAEESATLTVSLKDLPSDWRSYLKVADKMVTLYDDSLAWGSAVIWSGFINKVSATVNGTVKIQATGLKEYISSRIISNTYNSTVTDNKAAIKFSSSTDRGIIIDAINSCFSYTGSSSSDPRPPSNITKTTNYAGSKSVNVLLSDFKNYGEFCDEWRDEISDNGNEYIFSSSFSSSSKTKIQWSYEVATDSTPHIKENLSLSISLDDNSWKPISFDQSSSTDEMISRIIGQSKEGKDGKGSDYQTKTSTSGTSILFDESWNPGVELTQAQMTTNLTKRLNYNSKSFKEAEFETVYNDVSELKTLIGHLGKMVTFTGVTNTASQFFGLTMRIVGIAFNPSNRVFRIELAPQATRYPKLPKDRRTLKKKSKNKNSGYKKPEFDTRSPIVKSPKPGSNGSDVPGGNNGSGIKPPEAPTPPPFSNDKDIYEDEQPIIENVDKRWFKTPQKLANEDEVFEPVKHIAPHPNASLSRFNYKTGEVLGPNFGYQNVYYIDDRNRVTLNTPNNLKIYSMNIVDAFNRDNDPYKNVLHKNDKDELITVNDDPDANMEVIGEISFNDYFSIYYSDNAFITNTPAPGDGSAQYYASACSGAFEYNFFCSEDFQDVFVQIIFSVSRTLKTRSWPPIDSVFWSYTDSIFFKGTRNSEGKIESWDSSDNPFIYDDEDNQKIYRSRNIYEINGSYQSFGGYFLPKGLQQLPTLSETSSRVDAAGLAPSYSVRYYTPEIWEIDAKYGVGWESNTEVDYVLGGSPATFGRGLKAYPKRSWMPEYKVPYSVSIDYENEKILLGVVNNSADQTNWYEQSFANGQNNSYYQFKKVLETSRMMIESYGTSFSNIGSVGGYGSASGALSIDSNKMPYPHLTNPLIKYGENYMVFYGNSKTPYKSYNSEEKGAFVGDDEWKEIGYLRTKEGYKDVVQGELSEPIIPSSPWNAFNEAPFDKVLTVNKVNNSVFNRTTAFQDLWELTTAPSYINRYDHSGINYWQKDGYIYMIFETQQPIDGPTSTGFISNRFNYYIAKYKIKNELL